MSKKDYHHGNLKEQAIMAAIELSESEGLLGWSLRSLAKSMKVSHVALYKHFENKDELLYEVATFGFEKLIALSRDEKDIVNLGKRYIEFSLSSKQLFESMFHPALPPEKHQKFATVSSEYLNLIKKVISEDNRFAGKEQQAFLKGWTAVHGYALLASRGVFEHTDLDQKVLDVNSYLQFLWD